MRIWVAFVVLGCSVAAADTKPGPSAKELVDWVDAKLAAINSLEIEFETQLPGPPASAYVSTLTRTDVLQIVRGDKLRMRFQSRGVTTHACKQPGCKRPMPEPPSDLIVITDGDERIQYFPGSLTAHKSKTTSDRANPLRLAAWLRSSSQLARADAEDAYVLEVTDNGSVTSVFLSKATGLPTKQVIRSKGTTMTTTTKRVEVGKPISADRFTPPAGVRFE